MRVEEENVRQQNEKKRMKLREPLQRYPGGMREEVDGPETDASLLVLWGLCCSWSLRGYSPQTPYFINFIILKSILSSFNAFLK